MEKKKIDVSIIVPVYNVEKYLKKCLDSLVNQHYDKKKYEICIINDCSTDNSINVIREFINKYNNISFYDLKENKGVSNARNIGIEKSRGEYLIFCDADDYYDLDSIKILMDTARIEESDYIVANYIIEKNNNEIKVNTTSCFANKKITKKEVVSYMSITSCSKLIKKELFINNNVLYPTDLKRCEEMTVIPVLAYYANNPVKINDYLYYYVQRDSSASNKRIANEKDDLSFFDKSFNRFTDLIDSEKYSEEVQFRAIEHLLYGKSLVLLKSKTSRKKMINFINNFKEKQPKFLKNKYFKKFSYPKKIFVYTINYKLIFTARLIAKIHEKITG